MQIESVQVRSGLRQTASVISGTGQFWRSPAARTPQKIREIKSKNHNEQNNFEICCILDKVRKLMFTQWLLEVHPIFGRHPVLIFQQPPTIASFLLLNQPRTIHIGHHRQYF